MKRIFLILFFIPLFSIGQNIESKYRRIERDAKTRGKMAKDDGFAGMIVVGFVVFVGFALIRSSNRKKQLKKIEEHNRKIELQQQTEYENRMILLKELTESNSISKVKADDLSNALKDKTIKVPDFDRRLEFEKEAYQAETKEKAEFESRITLLKELATSNQIDQKTGDQLIELINSKSIKLHHLDRNIEGAKRFYQRREYLYSKYGHEIGERLLVNAYWIGMTKEQLIDAKGEPTKIETEVLKTKTKEILIYGTKSSGDYFVFENGIATKIVDR